MSGDTVALEIGKDFNILTTDNTRLQYAVEESLCTGELTPILKNELRCMIQMKRHIQGQEELKLNIENSVSDQLTKEDLRRREERKEKNKMAARKCRMKQKEKVKELQQRVDTLVEENCRLLLQRDRVQQEKEKMESILHYHAEYCNLNQNYAQTAAKSRNQLIVDPRTFFQYPLSEPR